MNWRRGLLLAGIHLAVAGTLILWQESRNWQYLHSDESPPQATTLRLAAWQEEQVVTFDPCGFWRSIPPQEIVVQIGELPAATLSGWGDECPATWTLYGVLHQGPAKDTLRERVIVAAAFGALIPIQWLAIGGFPMMKPRQWWWEPGAFITLCTVAAFVLVLIPGIGALSNFPMLFAALAWLFWLCLLVWKGLRLAWRLARV
jgi:hypothetical protein